MVTADPFGEHMLSERSFSMNACVKKTNNEEEIQMNAYEAAAKYQDFVEGLPLRCLDQMTVDLLMKGAAYIHRCMVEHKEVEMGQAIPGHLREYYHEEER